jgi:hypothetical protein
MRGILADILLTRWKGREAMLEDHILDAFLKTQKMK